MDLTAYQQRNRALTSILASLQSACARLLPKECYATPWYKLDLSVNNEELMAIGIKKPMDFEKVIFSLMERHNAAVGYGGFFEERRWYQQSEVFKGVGEPRTVHMGIDLWTRAGTPLFSPLDAKIHSFQDNANFLDYGPTVILEHTVQGETFYSLYGHLSRESLQGKVVGDPILKGEQFAWIGSPPTNGDWPPHLHIQLMIDMMGKRGDFPGVCAHSDVEFYKAICLDPQLLWA